VPETDIHTWHNRSDAFLFPYLKSAVSEKNGNYCIYSHRKSNGTQEFNKPKPTGSVSPATSHCRLTNQQSLQAGTPTQQTGNNKFF